MTSLNSKFSPTIELDINPNRVPLTIEKLKTFKGCESYSDDDAQLLINSLEYLAIIVHGVAKMTDIYIDNQLVVSFSEEEQNSVFRFISSIRCRMNTTNDLFKKWAKSSEDACRKGMEKLSVVYTRVSTKEQFEKNLSLDFQRTTIESYAERNQFKVAEYFGGTFESAKTDGRKEFQRMLTYVKKNKRITHILVYLLDRFSRTGGEAIKLAKELREKYGVTIIAVSQPIDTSNPGGVFQQNMQFLFSEYDNMLRRQRAMAGMKNLKGVYGVLNPLWVIVSLKRMEFAKFR